MIRCPMNESTSVVHRHLLPPHGTKIRIMEGERELTTGMLAKDANFRLIVSGKIGVKEIERLIKKLELDKEILGEPDDDKPDADESSSA